MESRAGTSRGRGWLLPVLLAAFGFLGALDQNVIVTALPRMLGDTNVSILQFNPTGGPTIQIDRAGWLVTGYLLGYVVVLPLMGAVSDVYGRRQALLAALIVFAAGSLFVALAQSLVALVLARAVQALGGGALLPVALAAAADVVPLRRQGLVLGFIAAMAELGSVCGPLYGAFITQHSDVGWRLIFWLNLPIAAVLALPALLLPARRLSRPVDYRGGLVLGLALAALAAGTSSSGIFGSNAGGGTGNRLFLVLCVACLAVLWQIERHAADPLLPAAVVRRGRFVASCCINAIAGVALIVTMVTIPLYATTVLVASPVDGGLLLLRYLLLLVVGALLGGLLRDRFGSRAVAALGLVVAMLGYWLMRDWLVTPPHVPSWAAPSLAGLGTGMVAAPVTTAALSVARSDQGGALASLVTAARVVGMMAGLSAISSWGSWYFHILAARVPTPRGHDLRAFSAYGMALQVKEIVVLQDIFMALAVACALAIPPAFLLGASRRDAPAGAVA